MTKKQLKTIITAVSLIGISVGALACVNYLSPHSYSGATEEIIWCNGNTVTNYPTDPICSKYTLDPDPLYAEDCLSTNVQTCETCGNADQLQYVETDSYGTPVCQDNVGSCVDYVANPPATNSVDSYQGGSCPDEDCWN